MKIRASGLVLALLGVSALAPSTAHAWSERTITTDQDNSNALTDPDDRVERMTGTHDDSQGYSSSGDSRNGSGFHFSVTQQPVYGPMPIGPLMPGPLGGGPFGGPSFVVPGR